MPLGTTNIKLSDIRGETSALVGTNDSFYDYNASSWAQGPAPGDNTFSIWGSGVRAAIAQNILYTPTNNGSTVAGTSTDFKFGFYKNYYGYFDQSNYIIELYVENNIPPASRPDPPNNIDFNGELRDYDLLSNVICPITATGVLENGGIFGPGDVSQNTTFLVNYFYISGTYVCNGVSAYNIEIYVNSGLEYSASVGSSAGPQNFDYTQFNTPDVQNNGSGFSIDVIFS